MDGLLLSSGSTATSPKAITPAGVSPQGSPRGEKNAEQKTNTEQEPHETADGGNVSTAKVSNG